MAVAAAPRQCWQLAPGKAPGHLAGNNLTFECTAQRARSSKLLSKET